MYGKYTYLIIATRHASSSFFDVFSNRHVGLPFVALQVCDQRGGV